MRILITICAFFFVLNLNAQVHSELSQQQLLQESYQQWNSDSSDVTTEKKEPKFQWLLQSGIQWINGPQQGRNNLYFNNKSGVHSYLSAAGKLRMGGLQFHFQPILINSNLNEKQVDKYVFPKEWWIVWWLNRVKWTNRMDDRSIALTEDELLFKPGNTYLSYSFPGVQLDIGFRQRHWGPSKGDALILSRHAPSFLQAGFGSGPKGLLIGRGRLHWDLMAGRLPSPLYAYDDNGYKQNGASIIPVKNGLDRMVNGFDIQYSVGKKNTVVLGLNHLSMLYPEKDNRLHRMIPLVSYPFALQRPQPNEPASMGSVYLQGNFAEERLSVWAEYGYGDRAIHPLSPLFRDTALYGYTLGASKLKPLGRNRFIELFAQLGYNQANTISQARTASSWYTHSLVKQGFTNEGQVLGNEIGPGGTSAYFSASLLAPKVSYGIFFERKMNNKDFFYANFRYEEFARQWMDLRLGLWLAFQTGKVRQHLNFSWMKSFCYQWQVKLNPGGFYKDYAIDQNGFRLSYEVKIGDLKSFF